MAQIRYLNYLASLKSKAAMEPLALSMGIGPVFGFNVASYDGNLLQVSGSPSEKRNLVTERLLAISPKSCSITPDGIMTMETDNININLTLSTSKTNHEIMVIVSHSYAPVEGGSTTSYRVIVNDTSEIWLPVLQDKEANIDTWFNILGSKIDKTKEVVVAYMSINKTGNTYQVPYIFNPYHYTWSTKEFIDRVEYDTDIKNIKSLLPQASNIDLQLSITSSKVQSKYFLEEAWNVISPVSILFSKQAKSKYLGFGNMSELSLDVTLNIPIPNYVTRIYNVEIIGTINNLLTTEASTMDFMCPATSKYSPDTIEKTYWDHSHSIEGTIALTPGDGNTGFILRGDLVPVLISETPETYGNINARLKEFTIRFFLKVTNVSNSTQGGKVLSLSTRSKTGTTGNGTVSGAGVYPAGTKVFINATPRQGSSFSGWYQGDTLISTSASYELTVDNDISLVAEFSGTSSMATITASTIPAGKGTITGVGDYNLGQDVTLLLTPNTGYSFLKVTIDGVDYSTNPITFKATKSLDAVFTLNAPGNTVNVLKSPADSCTVTGSGSYKVGTLVRATCTLKSGYVFKGWYWPGNLLLSNSLVYEFNMPEYDVEITAVCEPSTPSGDPVYVLALGFSNNNVLKAGGNGSNSVVSTKDGVSYTWTATVDQPWCIITNASGGNGGVYNWNCQPNTTSIDRTAKVTVVQVDGKTAIHTITQSGADVYEFSVAPTTFVEANGALPGRNAIVTSKKNGVAQTWIAVSDSSWCTLTVASGTNGGNVQYSLTANTGAERVAKITVTQAGSNRTEVLTVTQQASTVSNLRVSFSYNPPGTPAPDGSRITVEISVGGTNYIQTTYGANNSISDTFTLTGVPADGSNRNVVIRVYTPTGNLSTIAPMSWTPNTGKDSQTTSGGNVIGSVTWSSSNAAAFSANFNGVK